MEIEFADNMVVSGSAIDPDAVVEPIIELLSERTNYERRFVGGLHSLSVNDKSAWVRNNNGPLRIIEQKTGREEIWFFDTISPSIPVYLSINNEGLLESHKKYSHHMPAIHYTSSGVPYALAKTKIRIFDSHLDLWYHNHQLSNFEDDAAVNAGSRLFRIRDKQADYLRFILFKNVEEDWEHGTWKTSRVSGASLIFGRKDLNTDDHRLKATKWLNDNCKGGFFPFGEKLFGDKEEEFMFIADICT